MSKIDNVKVLHQKLRRLAAEDPREAREHFVELLDSGSSLLEPLLTELSSPGEGRLRQIIANAVRTLPVKERLVPYLLRWRHNETDEFAFRALEAALADVDLSRYVTDQGLTTHPKALPLADAQIVQAYRYASDRLKHKIRNSLLRPGGKVIRIRNAIKAITEDRLRNQLLAHLGELTDDLNSVGRVVESFEVDPDYFAIRRIAITDWLLNMNREYSRQFSAVKLSIQSSDGFTTGLIIRGSDHLLDTIFWNLWINAQQAIGENCSIEVRLNTSKGNVELLILDNGDGFSPAHHDLAFRELFSTKSSDRGRGLLEIQDAVERLHGTVGLVNYNENEYRIKILFPINLK